MSKNLLVIAGEVSGDMHAARVIERLREVHPDLTVWGVGGDQLRAAGMDVLYDVRDMAVLGLWEVLKRYGFFRRVFHALLKEMEHRRPDAVLLVDYPGFNLRFARQAHRRGFKVLYYICPQVWAWHRSRIKKMAQIIDRLMVIFPFEVEVFKDTSLRVDFVGHPLVDRARATWDEPMPKLNGPEGKERVALLPGSRQQEIERILPVMLDAAQIVHERNPGTVFMIAAPNERARAWIDPIFNEHPAARSISCACSSGMTRHVLRQARAAMVASGTATIETALMHCPMIVVYKTAALTYWVGKQVIRVPHLGMVNIVAGHECCPEFLQHDATPERMAAALLPLIKDTTARTKMLADLQAVASALGETHPAEKAAAIIQEELKV